MNSASSRGPAGVSVALGCLAHPASLVAIAVLVLNDHGLKGHAPGWLTGKLSDFAGLFFFPYLVALGFALVRYDAAPRAIGTVSFAVTATWFALAKTTPLGHRATLALVEALVGPSRIVRDPGDVVALLSLVPSWWLWSRQSRAPERSRRSDVLVGAVAGAACLGTSSPKVAMWPEVVMVTVDERGPAAVVRDYKQDPGCRMYRRVEAGTWREDGPVVCPTWRAELGSREARLSPQRRIRIAPISGRLPIGDEPWPSDFPFGGAIEESTDGGNTWRSVWHLPAAARASVHVASRGEEADLRLVDIAARPEASLVVVAFSSEGVLVREGDGPWLQESVGDATPRARYEVWPVARDAYLHFVWFALPAAWIAVGAVGAAAALCRWTRRYRFAWRAYVGVYATAWATLVAVSLLDPGRVKPRLIAIGVAGPFVLAAPLAVIWLERERRARGAPRPHYSLALGAGLVTPLVLAADLFDTGEGRPRAVASTAAVMLAVFLVEIWLAHRARRATKDRLNGAPDGAYR